MDFQSKYNIGDTVYFATVVSVTVLRECGDCLGKGTWEVASPGTGEVLLINCPTCSCGYSSGGRIADQIHTGLVKTLTIGQVSFETDYDGPMATWGMVFKYMCEETGIRSGSVYSEKQLFIDEAMAQQLADAKALEADAKWQKQMVDQLIVRRKEIAIRSYMRCGACGGTGQRGDAAARAFIGRTIKVGSA